MSHVSRRNSRCSERRLLLTEQREHGRARQFERGIYGYLNVLGVTSYLSRSRSIAGLHSAYLMATGLWPLVHRGSFEAVTGPKTDFWLVRTVGGLAAATGVVLGVSVVRGRQSEEIQLLAAAQAVVFVTADVFAAKTQSRLYLGDVVLQAACLPAWFVPWSRA